MPLTFAHCEIWLTPLSFVRHVIQLRLGKRSKACESRSTTFGEAAASSQRQLQSISLQPASTVILVHRLIGRRDYQLLAESPLPVPAVPTDFLSRGSCCIFNFRPSLKTPLRQRGTPICVVSRRCLSRRKDRGQCHQSDHFRRDKGLLDKEYE